MRPLVELVADDPNPALVTAVVGRILTEIRKEKGVPRAAPPAPPKSKDGSDGRPP
jgi:hypothetical protein